MANINLMMLKPDTLAQIVADLEEQQWELEAVALNALDSALVALAENVGQDDAELLIMEAHGR